MESMTNNEKLDSLSPKELTNLKTQLESLKIDCTEVIEKCNKMLEEKKGW